MWISRGFAIQPARGRTSPRPSLKKRPRASPWSGCWSGAGWLAGWCLGPKMTDTTYSTLLNFFSHFFFMLLFSFLFFYDVFVLGSWFLVNAESCYFLSSPIFAGGHQKRVEATTTLRVMRPVICARSCPLSPSALRDGWRQLSTYSGMLHSLQDKMRTFKSMGVQYVDPTLMYMSCGINKVEATNPGTPLPLHAFYPNTPLPWHPSHADGNSTARDRNDETKGFDHPTPVFS